MILTFNQILAKIETWVTQHAYYQDFGFGTDSMINTELENNTDLPILYLVLRRVQLNENTTDYVLTFKSLDSRSKTETDNYQDILSDQIQNLTDLRKFLIYGEDAGLWTLSVNSGTLFPLTNYSNDYLSGFEMELTLSTGLIESDCDVPYNID
jgi:hypothetical protein